MRKDSLGLFWRDIDNKTETRIEFLKRQGYLEYIPGYWISRKILNDPNADYNDHLTSLDDLYNTLVGTNTERNPPEPVWLKPTYLPHFEEAKKFDVKLFTDQELIEEAAKKHILLFDVETYINYFLVAFKSIQSGKIIYFEQTKDISLDINKLKWILENFCTVGFNTLNYDIPIITFVLQGATNHKLHKVSNEIINDELRPYQFYKKFKLQKLELNTIDLIEVAPLDGSLKIYGGRVHTKRMQDLPYAPETKLTKDQISVIRWYCINDLQTTGDLHEALKEEIHLREVLSKENGIDLRSKSDAQIAEAVIVEQLARLNGGVKPERPDIPNTTTFQIKLDDCIKYESALMQKVLDMVHNTVFELNMFGKIVSPKHLDDLQIKINKTIYEFGIGGLHSKESSITHRSDEQHVLIDRDVSSYYPAILLNQKICPSHLGESFLDVFAPIVFTRLDAKKNKDKVAADSLKIVVNGASGKLNEVFSRLRSPQSYIKMTLTGQLSILMLIERLELAGVQVVSANTDGVVMKCKHSQIELANEIIKQWEIDTKFETEETRYNLLMSRDVNNYVAVKQNGKVKLKGIFKRPGLWKNPVNEICIDAIEMLLTKNVPIETTIEKCKDIRKFVSVRKVKGGAVWNGEYLGKAVRWYYAIDNPGSIVYAQSGNKVARTEGARPLMDLPDELPNDINYTWYEMETKQMLNDCGYVIN